MKGFFTDAFGNKIICSNLFIVGTSNAGAEHIGQLVSSDFPKEKMQKEVVDYVLRNNIFSPEFLNRFDGVVVFNPLNHFDLEKIVVLMLSDWAKSLEEEGFDIEISSEVVRKLVKESYQPEFGARSVRRVIDIVLGDLFGKAMLSGSIKPGDKLKLLAGVNHEDFRIEKIT